MFKLYMNNSWYCVWKSGNLEGAGMQRISDEKNNVASGVVNDVCFEESVQEILRDNKTCMWHLRVLTNHVTRG